MTDLEEVPEVHHNTLNMLCPFGADKWCTCNYCCPGISAKYNRATDYISLLHKISRNDEAKSLIEHVATMARKVDSYHKLLERLPASDYEALLNYKLEQAAALEESIKHLRAMIE
jgi:hypothetical protein